MARLVAVAALLATIAGCGGSAVVMSVRITRTPGLFVLPTVDQTITHSSTASRLASDIQTLPPFPSDTMHCPIDFGTSYRLAFKGGSASATWTADVAVLGCQRVNLSDGRILWAVNSSKLFGDLGAALGLAPDELVPRPCPEPPGTHCYPQPGQ